MAKQTIGINGGGYVFLPRTKTILIDDLPELQIENFVLITDVTTNVIIYNFADPALGGTFSNGVLVLDYDVTSFSATDDLQIIINTPSDIDTADQVKIISDTPGQQPIGRAIPVALANEQILDYVAPIDSRTAPTINTIMGGIIDTSQYHTVALHITTGAGISAGVLIFEGCNYINSTSAWATIPLFDQNAQTTLPVSSVTLAASTDRYFVGPAYFRYFRVRVSTAVAGGQVTLSAVYSAQSFSPSTNQVAQSSGNWSTNIAQIGGSNPVSAGVAGTQAVGGNVAPGNLPTVNPVGSSGVDSKGLIRRLLTDSAGQSIVVGPDLVNVVGSQPIQTKEIGTGIYYNTELLEMILMELKLMSYCLKELPYYINTGQPIKETIDDFVGNVDKITNS